RLSTPESVESFVDFLLFIYRLNHTPGSNFNTSSARVYDLLGVGKAESFKILEDVYNNEWKKNHSGKAGQFLTMLATLIEQVDMTSSPGNNPTGENDQFTTAGHNILKMGITRAEFVSACLKIKPIEEQRFFFSQWANARDVDFQRVRELMQN